MFTDEVPPEPERGAAASANSSFEENQALSKAASRAGRRRIAARASLFDLANQKVVDELCAADPEELSPEEAKQLLSELRKQIL